VKEVRLSEAEETLAAFSAVFIFVLLVQELLIVSEGLRLVACLLFTSAIAAI